MADDDYYGEDDDDDDDDENDEHTMKQQQQQKTASRDSLKQSIDFIFHYDIMIRHVNDYYQYSLLCVHKRHT